MRGTVLGALYWGGTVLGGTVLGGALYWDGPLYWRGTVLGGALYWEGHCIGGEALYGEEGLHFISTLLKENVKYCLPHLQCS